MTGTTGPKDALLLVDLQNDFFEQGRLAVPGSNACISTINSYIDLFTTNQLPIIATRDWHPADHCSFVSQGGIWPEHCIAGSSGAAFHAELNIPCSIHIISKATKKDADAYSGFEGTDLKDYLSSQGIRRLFICGLATDYCVLATVKDALANRLHVVVLVDAIKAVNVQPDDGDHALQSMQELGAELIRREELF
ncbi:isochorismatase family protein [Desulfogranum japonicum]|uniref:isochorismatase family protein n=1 Tax=Desulfogranum japonicum TaxID=231447 RepID=UPI00041D8878|nr:isochorismatase family protein [Desulfogranum japonicum]